MFGIVICIFYFFVGEKSVLTKKRERERERKNLTLWHNAYTYTQDLTHVRFFLHFFFPSYFKLVGPIFGIWALKKKLIVIGL